LRKLMKYSWPPSLTRSTWHDCNSHQQKKNHQTGVLLIVCQELLLYKSLKNRMLNKQTWRRRHMRKFWEKTSWARWMPKSISTSA
jgi:hypothetical protein